MEINGHIVGVCSWSLQPRNTAELIDQVRQLRLEHLQLSLLPFLQMNEDQRKAELACLRDSGLKLTAGMIHFPGEDYSTIATIHDTGGFVSPTAWPDRKQLMMVAGRLASQMNLRQISVHMGFIPPSNHENYPVMLQRACELATDLRELNIDLLMETGQETASDLLQFINDLACRNVGVNFDPANMILYGAGDPIEAIRYLDRHIRHVHVKDAVMSERPGVIWGQEVPFGTGHVNPVAFLAALKAAGYTGPLVIEREAGDQRLADVQSAIETLRTAI